MPVTTELRWFYSGKLPSTVIDWFGQDALGQHVENWETRTDCYLWIPACEYLNIKQRENSLEVKLRQLSCGTWQFQNRWIGQVEQWIKWKCSEPLADDSALSPSLTDGQWISVEKRRSQRRYQITLQHEPQPVPLDCPIPDGCNIEITDLQIEHQNWWSLAFETFGQVETQSHTLRTVATWLNAMPASPTLEALQSFAYPKWLTVVMQA